MLYTFSQANYSTAELQGYFAQFTPQDAVLLWQDGVLLALKYPLFFHQFSLPQYFILEQDMQARGLNLPEIIQHQVRLISMADFVNVSVEFFPQVAL